MGSPLRLLAVAALGVLAGGWVALGRIVTPALLGWAALAAGAFSLAGWALQPESRATAGDPRRGALDFTVFAGALVGTAGAALVSGVAVLLGLAALAAMIGYARLRERRGVLGHGALAVLGGLPFMYGALASGRPALGTVPWVLAAWLLLLQATVADLETDCGAGTPRPGTLAAHLGRTPTAILCTVLALGLIPVSLVLPAHAGYGGGYFLVAVFAQLAVLVTAARLIAGRVDGLSALLKGAMVVGAVALVAGRIT